MRMTTSTLEDQQGHYASVCCWFSRTQADHAHASRQVGWSIHTNAPRCNGGKSSLQQDVTIERMHTIMDDQDGIISPPSPSQACQNLDLTTTNQVSVISCMDCSSHFVSHGHMCIVM